LPFRAYIICAPVITFPLSLQLPGDEGRTFDLSAGIIIWWADIVCLVVLAGFAWVAYWINVRKMSKLMLVYLVIGLVLSYFLIPLT
jgi:hypothetical protein